MLPIVALLPVPTLMPCVVEIDFVEARVRSSSTCVSFKVPEMFAAGTFGRLTAKVMVSAPSLGVMTIPEPSIRSILPASLVTLSIEETMLGVMAAAPMQLVQVSEPERDMFPVAVRFT